ncbi:MAG: zinc ribbon domain-containing protein [Sedimentisphaerales bacterium]|nr:zinc ribbon domain-containing protein [Sedimentisphaerales bacterium]
MYRDDQIDPGHRGSRGVLRVLGPVLMVGGLVLLVVGFGSVLGRIAGFGDSARAFGPPRHIWCIFVGMPIFFVGMVLTKFGYLGRVSRYLAQEIAPVGKDTFNYLAEGTRDGVETIAGAVGKGLASGMTGAHDAVVRRCPACHRLADDDDRFCSECGASLEKDKPCPRCGRPNDPDAKFCDKCGKELGDL